MNFTKAMIDLVMEIRRHAPREDKPAIKLANPELLKELMPLYHTSADAVFKALIKELFYLAGSDWQSELLATAPRPEKESTGVHRGDSHPQTQQKDGKAPQSRLRQQRMYRGQPILD